MAARRSKNRVMVELIKVSKTYPPNVEALTEISLSIPRGEMVFLTGKSGAGKTTLLRLLSKIETPDKGLIEIDGMDLRKLSREEIQKLRRRIGVAYQEFRLLPERTVARNISLAMEVTYRNKSFIERQTKKLLEQLGLYDKLNTKAADLSRGEQQRVAIARALANKPDLILADEPTGNLDAETTNRVMELFHEQHRRGVTILIATHDPLIYGDTTHRVLDLQNGRIQTMIEEVLDLEEIEVI